MDDHLEVEAHLMVVRQIMRMMERMPHDEMLEWNWHGGCLSHLGCS